MSWRWPAIVTAMLLFLRGALPGQGTGADLLREAQADLNAGKYQSVIRATGHAASLFRAAGDTVGLSRALTGMGLAHLYSGNYASALTSFQEALELARRNKDLAAEGARLNNIGAVNYELGRYSAS